MTGMPRGFGWWVATVLAAAIAVGACAETSQVEDSRVATSTIVSDPRIEECTKAVTRLVLQDLEQISIGIDEISLARREAEDVFGVNGPENRILNEVVLEAMTQVGVFTGGGLDQVPPAVPFVEAEVSLRCLDAYGVAAPPTSLPNTSSSSPPTTSNSTPPTTSSSSPPTDSGTSCEGADGCAYENGISFTAVNRDVANLVFSETGSTVYEVICETDGPPPNRVLPDDTMSCEFRTETADSGSVLLTVRAGGTYDLRLAEFVPFQPVD